MWIPTPSMSRAQRLVLYGSCAVALLNAAGLLLLLARQNQQRASLEQAEARLAEVEQSSVVEFLREAPRGAAGLRASRRERDRDQDRDQDQYSRNKRSEELDKETQRGLHQEEVQQLHPQEASQEVGEEAEKKTKMKHKLRHKNRVQEDVMTMMTYSMVPDHQEHQDHQVLPVTTARRASTGPPGSRARRERRDPPGLLGKEGRKVTMRSEVRGLLHGIPNDDTAPAKERPAERLIESLINARNVSKMETTFGTWMKDTARPEDERVWVAEHFSGRVVKEYASASSSPLSSVSVDVGRFFQGCGHAVHNGSLYFHIAGSSSIGRFHFLSRKLRTLQVAGARHHGLDYLLLNSKTYFKMAADDSGLWLLFASSADESVTAARLDTASFSVASYVNTTYPRTEAGNAFVARGVLYVTDTEDARVTFAFDLLRGKPVNVTFDLRPPGGVLAMLSYSPKDRQLYAWDQGYVRLQVVHFLSDE
ncbi:Gliomedin [Liparis tanakae]|uniref:Gliomedin n=1 Tax=Liparis tanakae TaxID=230148 RepID=A0A4Z2ESV0_9TELE|nr:Gliomedin [Liparis tanakae]